MPHVDSPPLEATPVVGEVYNENASKLATVSTAHFNSEELGKWQTSTRLLASLLNDYMLDLQPAPSNSGSNQMGLLLHGKKDCGSAPAVWIGLSRAGMRLTEPTSRKPAVFPGDFAPPIAMTNFDYLEQDTKTELSPEILFNHLRSVLKINPVEDKLWNRIASELANSAENGRHWIEWYSKQKPLTFKSSVIDWEQALYSRHPFHPVS